MMYEWMNDYDDDCLMCDDDVCLFIYLFFGNILNNHNSVFYVADAVDISIKKLLHFAFDQLFGVTVYSELISLV